MRVATVVNASAVLVASACDDDASRTTARVDRIESDRVCMVPEHADQTDLEGCFPARSADIEEPEPGDCIAVLVPNQLDPEQRDDPLQSIHVLDRKCNR